MASAAKNSTPWTGRSRSTLAQEIVQVERGFQPEDLPHPDLETLFFSFSAVADDTSVDSEIPAILVRRRMPRFTGKGDRKTARYAVEVRRFS
jgi:hypothetical protein